MSNADKDQADVYLALVRHGQPGPNPGDDKEFAKILESMDALLTPQGKEQSDEVAANLRNHVLPKDLNADDVAFHTSPLPRARATTQRIAAIFGQSADRVKENDSLKDYAPMTTGEIQQIVDDSHARVVVLGTHDHNIFDFLKNIIGKEAVLGTGPDGKPEAVSIHHADAYVLALPGGRVKDARLVALQKPSKLSL
jgi:phosphohistidine phosphatase SixA